MATTPTCTGTSSIGRPPKSTRPALCQVDFPAPSLPGRVWDYVQKEGPEIGERVHKIWNFVKIAVKPVEAFAVAEEEGGCRIREMGLFSGSIMVYGECKAHLGGVW